MVSVPHPDEWMTDDGMSELGAEGRRSVPSERRENGVYAPNDHSAPTIAGFGVPGFGDGGFGLLGPDASLPGATVSASLPGGSGSGSQDHRSSLVRPYAVTGGRTKPSYQLQRREIKKKTKNRKRLRYIEKKVNKEK